MIQNNQEILSEVLDQLRIQNRLTVMQILRTPGITQADVIGSLAATGAPMKEIARLMGTTPGTVKVAIARQRQKKRKKESPNGRSTGE